MSTPESAYLKPVVVSFPVTRYQCWVCDWHLDDSGPAPVTGEEPLATMRRWMGALETVIGGHLMTHAEPDRHGGDPLGWLSMHCFYSLPGCPEPACACRCHREAP